MEKICRTATMLLAPRAKKHTHTPCLWNVFCPVSSADKKYTSRCSKASKKYSAGFFRLTDFIRVLCELFLQESKTFHKCETGFIRCFARIRSSPGRRVVDTPELSETPRNSPERPDRFGAVRNCPGVGQDSGVVKNTPDRSGKPRSCPELSRTAPERSGVVKNTPDRSAPELSGVVTDCPRAVRSCPRVVSEMSRIGSGLRRAGTKAAEVTAGRLEATGGAMSSEVAAESSHRKAPCWVRLYFWVASPATANCSCVRAVMQRRIQDSSLGGMIGIIQ